MSGRSFGTGPFGTAAWPQGVIHELAGVSFVGLGASGEMLLDWAVPSQMCEPGTWTLTALPTGPRNDQLELVP